MLQSDIERVRAITEKNCDLIIKSLPPALLAREDELVSTFARHTGNYLSKLKSLYDFMDELSEAMSKYLPCKKGCTHCCKIHVSISELEAEFIRKHENMKMPKPKSVGETHGTPCSFLKKGACSIYKSRPFVCRQHVSTYDSPVLCRVDVCNDVVVKYPRFTEVRAVYDKLLETSGLDKRFDIRAIFPARK